MHLLLFGLPSNKSLHREIVTNKQSSLDSECIWITTTNNTSPNSNLESKIFIVFPSQYNNSSKEEERKQHLWGKSKW